MSEATPKPKLNPAQIRQVAEWKVSSPLVSCRIDPQGSYACAGAQDFSIQRFDLSTGKPVALLGHSSWVRGLCFHPKEKLLFSGGCDGKVFVWPFADETPKPTRSWEAHQGWVRAVACSPDGQSLATCGNDNLVKIWESQTGKLKTTLTGHASHVYNVVFHPKGESVHSCDHKGVVKTWDLKQGKCVQDIDASVLFKYDDGFRADIGGARSMAIQADGSTLACSGITEVTNAFAGIGKPVVVLLDLVTGKRKQVLRSKEDFTGTMWGVTFHPEGLVIGSAGGNGGGIWFWKPTETPAFATLKLTANARDLALHPDGKRLAIPFYDSALRLYDFSEKMNTFW